MNSYINTIYMHFTYIIFYFTHCKYVNVIFYLAITILLETNTQIDVDMKSGRIVVTGSKDHVDAAKTSIIDMQKSYHEGRVENRYTLSGSGSFYAKFRFFFLQIFLYLFLNFHNVKIQ